MRVITFNRQLQTLFWEKKIFLNILLGRRLNGPTNILDRMGRWNGVAGKTADGYCVDKRLRLLAVEQIRHRKRQKSLI